jgi:hypothetical protein
VFNDNFSICGKGVLSKWDVYGGVYKNLLEYSKTEKGSDYSPERIWCLHLKRGGVSVEKLNFPQNFYRG